MPWTLISPPLTITQTAQNQDSPYWYQAKLYSNHRGHHQIDHIHNTLFKQKKWQITCFTQDQSDVGHISHSSVGGPH